MDRVLSLVCDLPQKYFLQWPIWAWALHNAGIQHLTHYLDDFLFLVAPHINDGAQILSLAMRDFSKLGVPVARHKTEGPACVITFLGVCIDTIAG